VVSVIRAVELPLLCDDAWNAEHRAEAPLQRADRNFGELLQELRVAQTGVQILFAFLLTLSFMDRFAAIDAFQRGVYVHARGVGDHRGAAHRPRRRAPAAFQHGRKRELVRVGHQLALSGLLCLAATMLAGMLLVLDVVVGRLAAMSAIAAMAAVVILLWVGLPLRLRHCERLPPG